VSLAEDLAADGPPEEEFHKGVANRMARKRVAAGALIRDPSGNVLMVESTYRTVWDIPGGVSEADESPYETCRREVREELGIEIPIGRLLVIDWVPQQGVWHDALLFVFDGGVMGPGLSGRFVLPIDEIVGVQLVSLDEACRHVRPSASRRLRAAVEALSKPSPTYLTFGRVVGG
jgi:8-oxo-dGTP pyrophosphatase MutT (NUDIX family)